MLRLIYSMTVVTVYGQKGAGKTSLINSLINKRIDAVSPTIGADFQYTKRDDRIFYFWDVSGSELFQMDFLQVFIDKSKIILLCFDRPNIGEVNRLVNEISSVSDIYIIIVVTRLTRAPQLELYSESYGYPLFYVDVMKNRGVEDLSNFISQEREESCCNIL